MHLVWETGPQALFAILFFTLAPLLSPAFSASSSVFPVFPTLNSTLSHGKFSSFSTVAFTLGIHDFIFRYILKGTSTSEIEAEVRLRICKFHLPAHFARIASCTNSAVPLPPTASMLSVISPPPAYIAPRVRRISSEQ